MKAEIVLESASTHMAGIRAESVVSEVEVVSSPRAESVTACDAAHADVRQETARVEEGPA